MEWINQCFITLQDLHDIDDKVVALQETIDDTKHEVQLKLHHNVDDESTTKLVGDIVATIAQAQTLTVNDGILQLQALQKYDLRVVQELTQLYQLKLQTTINQTYLDHSDVIGDKLRQLSCIDPQAFEDIFQEITALDSTSVSDDIVVEVQRELVTQFNEKLMGFRLEVEQELKAFLTAKHCLAVNFDIGRLDTGDLKFINDKIGQLIHLQSINHTPTYPDTWWAMDILLEPFFVRFDYHFNTKKDTNKLSKPEWAFNFVEEFLAKNMNFLQLMINQGFKPVKKIMIYQVITSVLVPIRKKISSFVNVLNENIEKFKLLDDEINYDRMGRLLSHLIFELTSFDQRIRNTYKFNPFIIAQEVPTKKWLGLTSDILLSGDTEKLGTTNWLIFEKRLANNRFESEIINDRNSLTIDIDYKVDDDNHQPRHDELLNNSIVKPTYSSLNLVKLFDNLTDHYETMKMVKFQLKYVSTIQLDLLDQYYKFLTSKLSKFDELYNLLGVLKLIPGSMESSTPSSLSNSDVDESLKGLTMLSELYCLTKFLINNMESWSEELIFIQLWNAYKLVATKQYNKDSNIFESTINDYNKLLHELISRYKSFFHKGIRNYLKNYINSSQWDIDEVKDNSFHFNPLIINLPIYLNYIKLVISSIDYYHIVNDIVNSICSLWYEYIITNNKFTKTGTKQLKQDFEFIINKLNVELLIDYQPDQLLSTSDNHQYLKIQQSIKLLETFDSIMAKNLISRFDERPIRQEFDDKLNHLNTNEVKEILYRII